MPDVSIAISVKDNFSDAITTMRNANQSFNKDLTGTMGKLDELNKTKYQLKVDTDKAKGALKEAEKQFQRTGDAADKMARDTAAANFDNAKRNLNLVSQNAKQAEKDILSMTGAVEKSDNRASRVNTSENSASGGMLKTLANAGLKKMAGDTLSLAAKTYIGSAFNSEAGEAISSVVGGITTGAAIGSVVPGVGTAIGAAVGGVTGAVNAAAQKFQKEDDYFKSAVQETYNGIQNEDQESLATGVGEQTEYEGDIRAFSSLLEGNTKKATEFRDTLDDMGKSGALEDDTLAALAKEMIGLGDSTDTAKKKINDLDEAASGMGLSSSTVTTIVSTMEQIEESGTVSSKMLKTLERNGISAHEIIAKAFHIDKSKVDKELSKLDATSVVNALYNGMGSKFSGATKFYDESYEGLTRRVSAYHKDLDQEMGKGYMDESKKGYQSEINTLSGKVGKSLQEAYSMEGKFKAQLENAQKELMDNALTSVVTGKVTGKYDDNKETDAKIKRQLQSIAKDYQKQKALAEKGNMEAEKKQAEDVEEAKVIAANAYKASKGYQLELQEDLSLVGKIRDDTSLQSTYYDTGKRMGEEFSKGLAEQAQKGIEQALSADWSKKAKAIEDNPVASAGSGIYFPNSSGSSGSTGSTGIAGNGIYGWSGNATGLNRVPYNNYPTLLHEDEKVLTGAEARSQGKSSAGIAITGNTFNVRKESDIDEIASALLSKIQKARAVTP